MLLIAFGEVEEDSLNATVDLLFLTEAELREDGVDVAFDAANRQRDVVGDCSVIEALCHLVQHRELSLRKTSQCRGLGTDAFVKEGFGDLGSGWCAVKGRRTASLAWDGRGKPIADWDLNDFSPDDAYGLRLSISDFDLSGPWPWMVTLQTRDSSGASDQVTQIINRTDEAE